MDQTVCRLIRQSNVPDRQIFAIYLSREIKGAKQLCFQEFIHSNSFRHFSREIKVVNSQIVQNRGVLTNFIQQLTSAIFLVETTLDNTFISRNIFREKLWALLAILAVIFLPD